MTILLQSPLHDLHLELGARMTAFAGYNMPVQYPLGIRQEHLHTRALAGLFDVSHMGQFWVSGVAADVALERLMPSDLVGLPLGRQQYGLFTLAAGGVLDDLMISRQAEGFLLVVNAAGKQADLTHMQAHLPANVQVDLWFDRALLAVQGPAAEAVLMASLPAVQSMRFLDTVHTHWNGVEVWISRSGYTGEDGFEISVPMASAEAFARLLLADERVAPIGLGARDSLRLEAGLCLYGHELSQQTTPVAARLPWAIAQARRQGGLRAGGFLGAEVILAQLAKAQPVKQQRVGLLGATRAPVREGTLLFGAEGASIGKVTSGTFGPSVEQSIAQAYVQPQWAAVGTDVWAEVRGKRVLMQVCGMPFQPTRYYR